MGFYDGCELLSQKDINGEVPDIYLCTSNRSGGKTTYFNRLVVNRFLKQEKKFMLVYRFSYELDDVANKFFKEIGSLFFKEYEMKSKKQSKGIYHELFLNDKSCGYAVALNCADQIKKCSHFFADTDCMLMDEFQSETSHYCSKEVEKLLSIHTSVARGGGKQVRRVPIYMISNPVTLLNPYYTALGISGRLNKNTKFLKGEGWVLEQGYNETASKLQQESAFNRAFGKSNYTAYNTQGVYLNDNTSFIDKPEGTSRYLGTLIYNGNQYGILEYANAGILYVSNKADSSFSLKIAVTTEDHNVNLVMLKSNDIFICNMRYFFEKGCFRFKDLNCKEALLTAIGYY